MAKKSQPSDLPVQRELVRFAPGMLARTLAVVLFSEFAVMLLLLSLDVAWGFWTALLDSLLLTFLITVPLYFLILRPATELATRLLTAERFRQLLKASPVATRVIQHGVIAFSNSADAELFGYESPAEIIGMDASAFVADEDVPQLREYMDRRSAGEPAPRRYEARGKHRDGTAIPLELTAARITYDGQPASLVVLYDLRERKRLRLLETILPICSLCGKVRDDTDTEHGRGPWRSLEQFIRERSDVGLSHGFCPECYHTYRVKQGLPPEPPRKLT